MTKPQTPRDTMRSSGQALQDFTSKTWTAGVDVLRSYPYQDTQWHLNAIEFHHKVEAEAEALRDRFLAALPSPPEAGTAYWQSMYTDLLKRVEAGEFAAKAVVSGGVQPSFVEEILKADGVTPEKISAHAR